MQYRVASFVPCVFDGFCSKLVDKRLNVLDVPVAACKEEVVDLILSRLW
jgi:hypothetical protein